MVYKYPPRPPARQHRMTEKRALVILTNEAFLPKGGRGRFRADDPINQWATVHEPSPDRPADIDDSFTRMHRLTGIDALEVGYFWMVLKRHLKMDVTLASPRGGAVAIDPMSFEMAQKDEKLKDHLRDDKEFMEKLSHTLPIKWVDANEYSICLLPGRHGALFDLPECSAVSECIQTIYENGGWVAAIGHGVAGLLNVKASSKSNDYLLKNKRITCFSNDEEKEKRFDEFLPYFLEDKVKERGAQVEISKPFMPNVVISEQDRLITAQSFPSIKKFVQKIAEKVSPSHKMDIEAIQW